MEQKSILVIDDDADVLDLITETLKPTGHLVDQAQTREEIIQRLFQDGHYDLIITDVWMPWMSGLQVVNFAQMVGTNTPVLFVSGFADPSLEERVKVFGERARLLRKPFEPAELVRNVCELLEPPQRAQGEAFIP
jgi:CheY-like chemotaxis protein